MDILRTDNYWNNESTLIFTNRIAHFAIDLRKFVSIFIFSFAHSSDWCRYQISKGTNYFQLATGYQINRRILSDIFLTTLFYVLWFCSFCDNSVFKPHMLTYRYESILFFINFPFSILLNFLNGHKIEFP